MMIEDRKKREQDETRGGKQGREDKRRPRAGEKRRLEETKRRERRK